MASQCQYCPTDCNFDEESITDVEEVEHKERIFVVVETEDNNEVDLRRTEVFNLLVCIIRVDTEDIEREILRIVYIL